MTKHENHQFIEMNSKKEHGMSVKEVMCPECGEMRRMHEDGTIETMKEGKMMKEKGAMDDMKKE